MDPQLADRPDDLGSRIRYRRQALGLTRAEVADRAGLSVARVDHIETRPFTLTGAELVRLAQALDVSVEGLTHADRPRTPVRPPVAPHLEPMRAEECLRLIESRSIGRIAYAGVGELIVIPVNYCTLDRLIVFRTASDSAVAQYDLEPIAFELDFVDEGMRDGWSVLVNGTVRPAVDLEIEAVRDRVEPWAGAPRDTYLVIDPHHITGRRIRSW
ncbi:helix-turn-helix domain-containing protein [Kribbella sp. NPDC054772]